MYLLDTDTYEKLITDLRKFNLHDVANHLENNITDTNYNNSGVNRNLNESRPVTPTTENSDCVSMDSSDDGSSIRFIV